MLNDSALADCERGNLLCVPIPHEKLDRAGGNFLDVLFGEIDKKYPCDKKREFTHESFKRGFASGTKPTLAQLSGRWLLVGYTPPTSYPRFDCRGIDIVPSWKVSLRIRRNGDQARVRGFAESVASIDDNAAHLDDPKRKEIPARFTDDAVKIHADLHEHGQLPLTCRTPQGSPDRLSCLLLRDELEDFTWIDRLVPIIGFEFRKIWG